MKVNSEELNQAIASKDVRGISTMFAQAIAFKDFGAMGRLLDAGAKLTCELADESTPLEVVIAEDDKAVNQFLKPRCDAQTLAVWDAELKAFNALTGRKSSPRLSQDSFAANMNRPDAQSKGSAQPAKLVAADPPAQEKTACCTML